MTTTHGPDLRREPQDHALIQSVDRVFRRWKGDGPASERPERGRLPRAGRPAGLKTRWQSIGDRKMITNCPPSYGRMSMSGSSEAERVPDPFQGQEPSLFDAADILDRAVAGAEDLRRVGRDGTILRLHATSEHSVQRTIGFERLFRFLFVQARGISPRIDVRKSRSRSRGEGMGRRDSLTARTARHKRQQAAVDAAGLAKLFQPDRQALG